MLLECWSVCRPSLALLLGSHNCTVDDPEYPDILKPETLTLDMVKLGLPAATSYEHLRKYTCPLTIYKIPPFCLGRVS